MSNQQLAIECEHLRRTYQSRALLGRRLETVALDDVTFEVPTGCVYGLLGPNGAGKTTTVRVLATLLSPTAGSARVFGLDVEHQAKEVRDKIGLVLGGERGLYYRLTGRENLLYFGALNLLDPDLITERSNELLDRFGLAERADSLVSEYSRGMKQRLHLARGLLTDPELLFLDEPTIGLDPIAGREIRDVIPLLARRGKTILLTTHYMFEADLLCDRVALINKGRIVAEGTPADIKHTFSRSTVVEVTIRQPREELVTAIQQMEGVSRVDATSDGALQKLIIQAVPGVEVKTRVAEVIGQDNLVATIERQPTLEEAYISILE
jgi:ABC-2 type transport system ATP-binding protein